MNLTRAEKIRLGTFVAVSGAIFVGTVVTLAGLQLWEQRDVYTVSFLESAAQVKYQGLRVGRVESMRVDPKDASAIEVTISLEAGTTLFEGTGATLDMSGLTGLKTINLAPGDARQGTLKPGSRIPTRPSLVETIGDRAEAISARVELITRNLALWTGDANRERVERLLDSSDRLLRDVDQFVVETRDPLKHALTEVAKSGDEIRSLAEEGSKTLAVSREEMQLTLGDARKVINDVHRILMAVDQKEVGEGLAAASSAMKALDRHLNQQELARLFADLQLALTHLTRLVQDMDLTVRASREDLVLSLQYVRQAAQDLREFSRLIAQDPSVLVRGTESSE